MKNVTYPVIYDDRLLGWGREETKGFSFHWIPYCRIFLKIQINYTIHTFSNVVKMFVIG